MATIILIQDVPELPLNLKLPNKLMSEIIQQVNRESILKNAKDIRLSIPSDNINSYAVEKVNKYLPELEEKTKAFDRKNSQTSLGLMTLTMMTGQSPYRIMRQIMAETERRKSALLESQVTHAKYLEEIERLCEIFIELGVEKIRLTGGEPLVRKNIINLIELYPKHIGHVENVREEVVKVVITQVSFILIQYSLL